ncbi:MAG: V-type ATP synthase subunit E family protein [Candidatus Micrarchaeota archaeon]
MTLANLKEDLHRRVAAETAALEEQARAQARSERELAEGEADAIVDSARHEASEYASKERMRVSAANIKARRMVQDAQFGLVQDVIGELRALLAKSAADRKKYKPVFERLARDAAAKAGKDCVLLANKEDLQLARQIARASAKPIECIGGAAALSEDGRVKIDNTFEAILEEHDEEIRQRAYDLLFK